jgi:hypothetical protein
MRWFRRRRRHSDAAASRQVPAAEDHSQDAAERARNFWQRWEELLPEISSAFGDSAPQRVDHPVAQVLADLHPDLYFSIERGTEAIYALVVSAQGDPALRVYTDAWMAAAPRGDALWEYHDSIPPVPDPTQVTVTLRGEKYPLAEVRIAAQWDAAAGLVDVAVYHPCLAGLDDAARRALTFLPLDASLGERLAADRIGRVEIAETPPHGALGLLEFRTFMRELDEQSPRHGERGR